MGHEVKAEGNRLMAQMGDLDEEKLINCDIVCGILVFCLQKQRVAIRCF